MVSNGFTKTSKSFRKLLSLLLVLALALGMTSGAKTAYAATAITSMQYYSAGDGPVLTASGVDSASYGFVMPVFNGGTATWADVSNDMQVNVKVNEYYKNGKIRFEDEYFNGKQWNIKTFDENGNLSYI